MSDTLADKIKAAREVLIGLNATDEQMNALADVFDFGSDTIEALRAENARIKESNLELQAKVEGIYNYLVEEKHENKRLREAGKEVVDWWLRDGMNEFEGAPASMFNLRAALGDE